MTFLMPLQSPEAVQLVVSELLQVNVVDPPEDTVVGLAASSRVPVFSDDDEPPPPQLIRKRANTLARLATKKKRET